MGYNAKVTKHTYGISGRSSLGKTSNGIDAREYMESKMKRDQQAVLEASIHERDNVVKQVTLLENVNARKIGDKQSSFIIGDMTKAGRDYAFKYAMGVIFENCLLLDDYYVKENSSKIRAVMESYIDKNGGIALLENALKTNKTRFLTMLMEACNKTASKCAKRKLKEAQEAGQTQGIKFDMTDEEKEELDTEISTMDVEQLSSVVKDKVLTVIKDEKERAQQREEFERDLADGVEDAIVKEQTFRVHNKYCSAKETLFNAFMTESYKEVLESVALHFDMGGANDEVDEIGLDIDEVDYEDKNAHSLSELDKNNEDITSSEFKGEDNFKEIPDDYDESLTLDDYESDDEEFVTEFQNLIQEEIVFEANGLADLQMKVLDKQAGMYEKNVRRHLKNKKLKDLLILQEKKKAGLKEFKHNLDNYKDKSAINKAINSLLFITLSSFEDILPAKLRTKSYLRKAVWLAEHELKVIGELIKEKKAQEKGAVKESISELMEEFEVQLEGFDAFEQSYVIGLCQKQTLEELTEASIKAEELVYTLEADLQKEKNKSDEEKEKELEDAAVIYGNSLAKNYVGEAKVLCELENARKKHKCIEKAIELKPEIPECENKDCKKETEEGLIQKPQLRKMAKRRSDKVKKKALVMDQVMAEALTKYTLLETLYTVKLENYTVRDVMDLSVRLTSQK